MSDLKTYEKQIDNQTAIRKAGVAFIKTVSDLWYDKSIELVLFRNQLIDTTVSDIINLHDYAEAFVAKPINIFDSVAIALTIKALKNLPPSRIDIGKLSFEYSNEKEQYKTTLDFVTEKLKLAQNSLEIKPRDVVLYGFGRIGRLLARELMSKVGKGEQLRLRAIVTRDKNDAVLLEKRASLLRYDSVHGDFQGSV
jgi:glyceraldehyde 3-phosphate dehydrogenase